MFQNDFLSAVAKTGLYGGVMSGIVKLGWEVILPARTPERDETNPPQKMLEQVGVPPEITHSTYTYSGHKLPWVSFLMHFGFSISWAAIYAALAEKFPAVSKGHGTIFGLFIWILFHIVILPAVKTIPSAADQPVEEHISEALGHSIWMWEIESARRATHWD